MNLLEPFLRNAEQHGDRSAIVAGNGERTSFADLIGASSALASTWRRAGIGRGDRVLIAMPLGPSLYAGLAALWRIGAVAVLPEPALGLAGLRHAARATAPKAYLSSGWFRALRYLVPELWPIRLMLTPDDARVSGEPLEALTPEHPALISFTSGSTGRPKAIQRSHGFLAAQSAVLADLLAPKREDETDLVAFPVFVVANLGLGVTSVLPSWNLRRQDRAEASLIAEQISTQGVTRALLPPSICETLARADAPLRLDAVFTGGGPVFPDLLERLSAKIPEAGIVAVYGSTEAEPIAHLHHRDIGPNDWSAMKSGAGLLAGCPVDAVQLAILDDEIVVTGDHVNKGYLDPADDASTKLKRAGQVWHRTGDSGHLDAKGRLWLCGRLDGRAGQLLPFGIEAASRFWPGVRRSALVEIGGRAQLAVEGDQDKMPVWTRAAAQIGDVRVVGMDEIPLDRRHRSKVDYVALRAKLQGLAK
ncbi:AMP-binding protein [Bosea psychrotolerans]|uniref:Acyl-CoA synthetase (AMP-forming)/AMP-acid ligase II n=1 Tax=Bosea psychrotolerans TaxID=1871628 RepID=A0A2S4MF08_9HYPH|nr:AMP-binding protein [Bosea psychrotolerans]POR53333.1 acyl-CoA synthetase (AMP-forming)/AMP-acid ligase II [Bosea psychrotolerans]